MKYLFILFLGVSLLFSSCQTCECCACEGAAGEMDVTVLNMDNKPISGVGLTSYKPYSFLKGIFQTDANGRVKTTYAWPIDNSGSWTLTVPDANDYQALNYIESPYSYTPAHKKVIIIDTIRVDSLRTIAVRFKANRADAQGLLLRVDLGNSPAKTKISRNFYNNTTPFSVTSPFDTTIYVRTFAKAEIFIEARLRLKNFQPDVYQGKQLDNFARRDTVFLFQF